MKITKKEIKNFLNGNMNSENRMRLMANAKYELDNKQSYQTKKELINQMYSICNIYAATGIYD